LKRVILLIIILLFLAGCRQSQQEGGSGTAELSIELVEPTAPTLSGSTEMTVRVSDGEGTAVNNAALSIKGDMTHAGMMPVLADVDGGNNGLYTVPFAWTMTGDWIVTVRATLPDGTWSEQQFDLRVLD